jgi:hypothetical protein
MLDEAGLMLRARAAKLGRWQLWQEPDSSDWGAAIVGFSRRVRAVAATPEDALTKCCEKLEAGDGLVLY